MSVIITLCENGELVNRNADDFFRYHDSEHTQVAESGDVESPTGHFTLRDITAPVIVHYVSEYGDPWMSEKRNFDTGWYIDVRGSDGTVWAFSYRGDGTIPEEQARADYAKLEEAYGEWLMLEQENV